MILVAEDHPINQQVIARQLTQLGYGCMIASDGAEALKMLGTRHCDLLLTDLHMPGLDGFGLADDIRRQERDGQRAGHLPILALSAAMLSGEKERCRRAGMDDFLTKPIALHGLRKALELWIAPRDVAPENESPLDFAILRDMSGGDDIFVNHLLAEFLRINRPLRESLPRYEGRELSLQAHRLLGSARTVGASALASVLAALEEAANRGDKAASATLLKSVDGEFATVEQYIRARGI